MKKSTNFLGQLFRHIKDLYCTNIESSNVSGDGGGQIIENTRSSGVILWESWAVESVSMN